MRATTWRCALASALLASTAAAAPCVKDGTGLPAVGLKEVASGFKNPTHLASAFDGSKRLFVVEQAGVIRLLEGGKLREKPFLDIRSRVASGGEKGLLSVAFHPRFKENGRFFVNYTSSKGGLHTVVSEFGASGEEKILFTQPQPYSNHNGGQLAFGPDGLLYIGLGDGGSGNDPQNRAQDDATFLGKIVRLDVGSKGAKPEIYAKGLRNPWRFSFDPVTGRLWAADVGQDRWEEIDIIEKGGNYGWRVMEGRHCNADVPDKCDPKLYRPPVHEYGRDDGISVTGGFVYRGGSVPGLCGAYLFSDYGTGPVWALRVDKKGRRSAFAKLAETEENVSSFGEDEDRELYVLTMAGALLKVAPK